MSAAEQFQGIVRARTAAARSLVNALNFVNERYSEKQLADSWLHFIETEKEILPFGWYQPPPSGMSVLIGKSPTFERLAYRSLREEENFPSEHIAWEEGAVLYPYFSAIDRDSRMIGDHVATYYGGYNRVIRDLMRSVYALNWKIIDAVRVGMSYAELYDLASELIGRAGAENNTYSISGGRASDIGHTVPFFGDTSSAFYAKDDSESLCKSIAGARHFVGASNKDLIEKNSAFTIEPQVILSGMPMVSFHMIVVLLDGTRYVVEKFTEIFDLFGMHDWIYSDLRRTELS